VNTKSKNSTTKYKTIGLMSGTSLDGLDIAYCIFTKKNSGWTYSIEACETIHYSTAWKTKLSSAHTLPSDQLIALHHAYGSLLGTEAAKFLEKHLIKKVDFIASHGHTIFHQPSKGYTFQLGDGNALHAVSGVPVVFDFRSLDIARGGQGAPLVPIGDQLLFSEYDVCLNLGGIANLSKTEKGKRIAFDVCYANMGLNFLAQKINKPYDRNGELSERGDVNEKLLSKITRAYATLRLKRPSLAREGFENVMMPLLNNDTVSIEDRLCTFTESIVTEIVLAIGKEKTKTVLCTGGGAFNRFLLYRLIEKGGDEISLTLPEDNLIKFKEALVFAFLGVLRVRGEVNTLKSVTGASKNSSGGVMVGF
jgi:anhydro-N-acetylmuramic acid kinase